MPCEILLRIWNHYTSLWYCWKNYHPYPKGDISNHLGRDHLLCHSLENTAITLKYVRYLFKKSHLRRIIDESMFPGVSSRMLSLMFQDRIIRVMKRLTVNAGLFLCIFAGTKVIQIAALILIHFLMWKSVWIVPAGDVEKCVIAADKGFFLSDNKKVWRGDLSGTSYPWGWIHRSYQNPIILWECFGIRGSHKSY